jgi:hypothetical protein
VFMEFPVIFTKDHKTRNMFDPLARFGPHRRRRLEQSWAKLFRDEILPELPVYRVTRHYSGSTGAPTKDLYAMLGIMLLQQMHDLTDEEAVNQVAFNLQWQYALDISEAVEREAYVCPKTLWSMRQLVTEKDLSGTLFETVTDKLAKVFSVDPSRQRQDSMHVMSNMRHLGRIGLFVRTIRKFLVNLKRHHKELFVSLPSDVTERYMNRQGEGVFSLVKPSESGRTLQTLGADVLDLVERFRGMDAVVAMSSYQLLVRLLREQCTVEEGAGGKKVSVKPNKEVPSDSLQSPSDPDAGYSGHKGKGYTAQVVETYSPVQDKGQLSLITHVSVSPAHHSDAHALIPAIEDVKTRGLGPDQMLADSLYGSDDNCEKAKQLGVEVISPVMGTPTEGALTLVDFTLGDGGEILRCPQGQVPRKTKHKRNRHSAVFSSQVCAMCPQKESCPVKPGKRGHYLRYDEKALRLLHRRAFEGSEEFRETYRFRAGIEGAVSQLDRLTGIKRLRVRGLKAVRFCAFLKAAGVNLFRAAAFKAQTTTEDGPQGAGNHGAIISWRLVREQLVSVSCYILKLLHLAPSFRLSEPKMAA